MKTDPESRSQAPVGHARVEASRVFPNLSKLAQEQNDLAWRPFHPGVDIHWLYREENQGPSAALIRFQPGGSVPLHEHRGFEHIYILSGSQSDGNGRLTAGSLMVHLPGSRHSIVSEEGCLVLAIYEKPARFANENAATPP